MYGKYYHNYKHSHGEQEVNRMHSEKIVRYHIPTSGHALVFGGSSEIVRLRKDEKKRKKQAESILLLEESSKKISQKSQSDNVPELFECSRNVVQHKRARVRDKRLYYYSKRSAATIRSYATTFYRASKCAALPVTFITLTFIQDVEDKKAMRCLTSYLNNWKKRGHRCDYISVIERQKKGRLHFHLLVNRYVDIEEENRRWTRVQYNNGLFFTDKEGVVYSRKEYEQKIKIVTSKKVVNPFNIQKVYDSKGVSAYLSKYISKSLRDGEGYEVKTWSCSLSVSKLYKNKIVIPELFNAALTDVNTLPTKKPYVDKETGEIKERFTPWQCLNEYAHAVGIVNKMFFEKHFVDMDIVNAEFLLSGRLAPPEYVHYETIYNKYNWNYSKQEIEFYNDDSGGSTPLGWLPGSGVMRISKAGLHPPIVYHKVYNEGSKKIVYKPKVDHDSYTRFNRAISNARRITRDNVSD